MLKVEQIYKDLIDLIKMALTSQSLTWQVIQNYQQSMGNLEPPYVMLHRLTTSNYGFQFGKDYEENGNSKHSENQIEIQSYQIEAVYKRTSQDSVSTITGADVARVIARWFMSDTGIQAVREKGYNVFRITEVEEEYYKDVSVTYQINPHFRLDLVALQTDVTNAHKINSVSGNIKEVEQLKREE